MLERVSAEEKYCIGSTPAIDEARVGRAAVDGKFANFPNTTT